MTMQQTTGQALYARPLQGASAADRALSSRAPVAGFFLISRSNVFFPRTFKMKSIYTLVAAAALALATGTALAESQYGYDAAGSATVTAKANVKLSVAVPKLVLLRIGDANATINTLSWTAGLSLSGLTDGSNKQFDWNGAAPTTGTSANPTGLQVYAWTNAAGGGSLSYAATEFTGTGPKLANFTVQNNGTLNHPGGALATASGSATTFGANDLKTSTWTYQLSGGTPSSWQAGTYTTTVTYTATTL